MIWGWFTRDEFACKCGCGYNTVDADLLSIANRIRNHYNAPVTVTSGCRCIRYNREVGGAEPDYFDGEPVFGTGSQHIWARAMDLIVAGVHPASVAAYCVSIGVQGLGEYSNFTHVDTRSGPKARW